MTRISAFPAILVPALSLLLLSGPVDPSRAQALSPRQALRQSEEQSWREYIDRFAHVTADSSFDVRFYDIAVDIAIDTPWIEGEVRCDFDAAVDGLDRVHLDLHDSFAIDSLAGDVSGYSFANDTITVDLDRPYAAGEPASVTVYYRGVPELAGNLKGLRYETHGGGQPLVATLSTPFLAHYWWPCKDGPGDKPDSVYIDIAIPDTVIAGIPLMATSNGLLDSVIVRGGKRVFQWRERYPIVPYYVMAEISNYRTFRQEYDGGGADPFPIDYFVFDESYDAAQQGVAQMPEVADLFGSLFGPYPFDREKYGMTELGFYGAIENQTNTITNSLSLSWFEVNVHEFAHMWFGDMITCRDWHHGWLNEGFATYAEALWAESTGGMNAYRSNIAGNAYYGGGTVYLQDISDPFQIFLGIIYQKGAYVLHMLRGVMGDEAFFQALLDYTQTPAFRYGHAVTEDFRDVCESASGLDLDVFFEQWIYDEYYPSYEYGFWQDPATLSTRVTIEQTQGAMGRRAVFEMPVQLRISFEGGGDTLVTVLNDAAVQTFEFPFSATVRQVLLDPDGWILRTASPVGIDDVPRPDLSAPRFALAPNYPNPFNPSTTIAFDVPGEGDDAAPGVRAGAHVSDTGGAIPITLVIHDVRGRRVRTLIDRALAPGRHEIAWDGRDGRGRPVASGIYLYTLKAGRSVATRRMTVTR